MAILTVSIGKVLSVPGGYNTTLRLTNSVLSHLSDVQYALVCTQQMDQTCPSCLWRGRRTLCTNNGESISCTATTVTKYYHSQLWTTIRSRRHNYTL